MNIDLEKTKERLVTLRAELARLSAASEEAAATVELDQQRVGRLSRMDAMQAQAVSAETLRRRKQEILRINAAIARIDEGEYGYCVKCDEEIASARLELNPATPLCITNAQPGRSKWRGHGERAEHGYYFDGKCFAPRDDAFTKPACYATRGGGFYCHTGL